MIPTLEHHSRVFCVELQLSSLYWRQLSQQTPCKSDLYIVPLRLTQIYVMFVKNSFIADAVMMMRCLYTQVRRVLS